MPNPNIKTEKVELVGEEINKKKKGSSYLDDTVNNCMLERSYDFM